MSYSNLNLGLTYSRNTLNRNLSNTLFETSQTRIDFLDFLLPSLNEFFNNLGDSKIKSI